MHLFSSSNLDMYYYEMPRNAITSAIGRRIETHYKTPHKEIHTPKKGFSLLLQTTKGWARAGRGRGLPYWLYIMLCPQLSSKKCHYLFTFSKIYLLWVMSGMRCVEQQQQKDKK